jgi:hypothetical protein
MIDVHPGERNLVQWEISLPVFEKLHRAVGDSDSIEFPKSATPLVVHLRTTNAH